MPTQTGCSIEDELYDWIEAYRQRQTAEGRIETVSRSQAIEELLRLGRIATEMIEEEGDDILDLEPGRPREAWVRQACLTGLEAERRDRDA